MDQELLWMLGGIAILLSMASIATRIIKAYALKSSTTSPNHIETISNLNDRIKAWWAMAITFSIAMTTGGTGSLILFSLISFLSLRELITLTPTKKADYRTLLWCFFIVIPLQYLLIGLQWYALFSILIPVYAFIFISIGCAVQGDTENFLERAAKIQWGLMISVYCVSHVPALLTLNIPNYEGENIKLLLFFVIIVQLSDILQYVWGKLLGKRKIAAKLSPNKTLEGFLGGVISASLVGTALYWATPFTPWQAFFGSLIITIMGFFGGLVMSAVKRDKGIKDYGAIIKGHGGMMDRIDSLCFAAPIFFHFVRFYFTE
jgi:phosphatidate cytidylyltransferase